MTKKSIEINYFDGAFPDAVFTSVSMIILCFFVFLISTSTFEDKVQINIFKTHPEKYDLTQKLSEIIKTNEYFELSENNDLIKIKTKLSQFTTSPNQLREENKELLKAISNILKANNLFGNIHIYPKDNTSSDLEGFQNANELAMLLETALVEEKLNGQIKNIFTYLVSTPQEADGFLIIEIPLSNNREINKWPRA